MTQDNATALPDTTADALLTDQKTGGAPRWLFTVTILVGSFLLFLVQPMIARMALPRLGGAPAVWNSAMLVYQALLLGGYAWAHWLGRWSIKRQMMLHCGLLLIALILSVFPIGLRSDLIPPSDGNVILFVPVLLVLSVGTILFAISAQAPLMQRWFAESAPGQNPYALYAASNLGSFGGLIAYPLLVEPNMRLIWQSWGWSTLYIALVGLVALCGLAAVRATAGRSSQASVRTAATTTPLSPAPTKGRIALWIALSAVPSGLMLSTTTHLTTDIMAMPLMWAIPLGLYLLSFTIAFAERRWLADFFTLLAPAMLLLSGGLSMWSQGGGGMMIALTSLIMLFTTAVSLHGYLYSLRPEPDRLTLFYLIMSVGGALGGLFCALIAPLIFDWVYEHPILIVAAALLLPLPPLIPWADWVRVPHQWHRIISLVLALTAMGLGYWLSESWTGYRTQPELVAAGVIVIVGLLAIGWRIAFVAALVALLFGFGGRETIAASLSDARTRSYFGVYTVRDNTATMQHTLTHGTTLHGTQLTTKGLELTATSYYGPQSGVGIAFSRASLLYGDTARIGVIGLGTGTLSCYRRAGQDWTFYEIDPAMVAIARDSGDFTFVPRCADDVPIILGDARIKLQERPAGSLDILAVDAFSSDAIPLHLLTKEAFDVYGRAVQSDGLVLVHISNRFMNLEPVLRALENTGQWHAVLRHDEPDETDRTLARTGSIWVAMSHSKAAVDRLVAASSATSPAGRGDWRPLTDRTPPRLWTDDFASVLPLLSIPIEMFGGQSNEED